MKNKTRKANEDVDLYVPLIISYTHNLQLDSARFDIFDIQTPEKGAATDTGSSPFGSGFLGTSLGSKSYADVALEISLVKSRKNALRTDPSAT